MGDDWANEMTYEESESMRIALCALVTGLEVRIPWGDRDILVRMDKHGAIYHHCTVVRLGEKTTEYRWMKLDVPVNVFLKSCQQLSQYSRESLSADVALNLMYREKRKQRA